MKQAQQPCQTERSVQTRSFAANLARWRGRRKLSLKEAAQKLGVAKSTWSQWESSKRQPSISWLPLLARVLQIRECSLLTANVDDCEKCARRLGAVPTPKQVPRTS